MGYHLPQLFLPLSVGTLTATPPKKSRRLVAEVVEDPNAKYTDAASRVLSEATAPALTRYDIWARPALSEEEDANMKLTAEFSKRKGDVPGLDDLINVAKAFGSVVAVDKESKQRATSTLPPKTSDYILDFAVRSDKDNHVTRVDFEMKKKWRPDLTETMQEVLSFEAYKKMNLAVEKRMKQVTGEVPTSVERVMVVLPRAKGQELHKDGGDELMCTVALNLRQTNVSAGSTAFPAAPSPPPTKNGDFLAAVKTINGTNADENSHFVNNSTGYVSAWSGSVLHRGTENESEEPRVFMYTEWALGQHN